MSLGLSLPGIMLALTLLALVLGLGVQVLQQLRGSLQWMARQIDEQQAVRQLWFNLSRQLRQGQALGCIADSPVLSWHGHELVLRRFERLGAISHLERDADGRLSALTLVNPLRAVSPATPLVLASCAGQEVLNLGADYQWLSHPDGALITLLSDRALIHGHHLPSLQLGQMHQTRYQQQNQQLLRQDGEQPGYALLTLDALTFSEAPDGALNMLLRFPRARQQSFSLIHKQRGMALVVMLILSSVAMLILTSSQRLLLDEQRQVQLMGEWWQTLHLAEYVLAHAEREVLGLDQLPGHASWFTEPCHASWAQAMWRMGLCKTDDDPSGPPVNARPWLKRGRLAPCRSLCIPVGVPSWYRANPERKWRMHRSFCPLELHAGPFNPMPCYIVELLDEHYQGGGLYRISARAWGSSPRTQVTLQSYFAAAARPGRLAWSEIE